MTESRQLLQHFLAALAYRTQIALRGAPEAARDAWWTPDAPPRPPATHASKMADDIS